MTANRDSLVGAQLDAPLRTMLEGMPDYLLVLDASGRILYVSAPIRDLERRSGPARRADGGRGERADDRHREDGLAR